LEKENFISKLNIKDYNNQLEKILSKKTFSEDIKNLLLSMLYKIENAYDDYSLVKGETKTKKETLEEILYIIANDCEKIELVKTKESRAIIDEKKIITYLNVRKMLYEIYQLDSKKFEIPNEYNIIKLPLEQTLNQGYSISSAEVIRDFDGWSWNIVVEEIENLTANLIYQTLKILVGDEFLEKWKKDKCQDYIVKLKDKLEETYKMELAEKIFKLISQIAILNVVNQDEQEKTRLIQMQEKLQKEFDKINNKKEYITALGNKKKQLVEDIKKIDSILNNDRNLKNEFIKRNELLDMNHRIFSLSDLADILEMERENLIKDLNKYSKKMEPINYIKTKEEIENKLTLIKELDLQNLNKKTYNTKIKELLKLVGSAIKIQVDITDNKDKIISLLYKMRYYSSIYVQKDKQIKEVIDLNTVQRLIITKACKLKSITIFSRNIKENYEIIKNILKTDIIEVEKLYFKFIQNENKILLEIYDEENLYKSVEYDNIEELNVKLNKKIKVFI